MAAKVLGYHHLSLSVTDLDRSTAWYQAALGLHVTAEIEAVGFRRTRLQPESGGLTITLTCHHDQQPEDRFDERRIGMDHVSLMVEPGSIPAFVARFAELGIAHSEVRQYPGGVATLTFRDPDNIQLEVFAGPTATE